jgi:autotransporter-associated beta strand protein
LAIATINNAGTNGTLGNNSSVSLGTPSIPGTLEYTGGTAASTMPFSLAGFSIAGGGVFQVDSAATNLTLSGVIGGLGALTKTGAGTLTLSGNNSFTGGVQINNGILKLGGAGALNAGGANALTFGSPFTGLLTLNGFSLAISSLNSANSGPSIQNASPLGIPATVTVNDTGTDAFNGALLDGASGGPLSLVKSGSGVLTLNGNNLFTGGVAINGGALQLGNPGALNTSGVNSVTFNGVPSATLTLAGNSVVIGALASAGGIGFVQNNSVVPATLTFSGGSDFSGIIQDGAVGGSLSLIKIGAATQQLDGNNTFTGGVSINGGTLLLGSAGALNASGVNPVTFSGVPSATLTLAGNSVVIAALASAGGKGIVQNASVMPAGLAFSGGGDFSGIIQDGAPGGSLALTKVGAGTQQLDGNNTFTGGVTINGGTLQLGNPGALNASGVNSVTFNSAPSATLSLSGNSITIAALASAAGRGVVQNASSIPATLTIAGGSDYTGILQDGAGGGALALIKNGPGNLRLTGNNTFTGGTSFNSGKLIVGGSSPVGTGTVTMAGGTTLQSDTGGATFNNAISISPTVTIDAVDQFMTLNGVISGTGGLTVNTSGGILTLGGPAGNSYSGGTTVNGALVLAKSSGNAAVPGPLTILSGSFVTTDFSEQIADNAVVSLAGTAALYVTDGSIERISGLNFTGGLAGSLKGPNPADGVQLGFQLNSGSVVTNASSAVATIVGNLDLNGSATFSVAQGTTPSGIDLDVPAVVADGSITKLGFGVLRLTGNSTFAGGLTLNSGKVIVGGTSPIGTGLLAMAIGTTLQANTGGATLGNAILVSGGATIAPLDQLLTLNGAISGSGGLTANTTTGLLTLGGPAANTYSGTTTVSGALVLAKASGNAVPGPLTIGNGALVTTNLSEQIADNAVVTISETGALYVTNGSTEHIGGLNFTGGLASSLKGPNAADGVLLGFGFNLGTVVTNASSTVATISGNLDLNGMATFTVAQGTTPSGIDLDIPAVVADGSIVKNGAGALRLSGNNTFAGGLILNAGKLLVAGNSALGTGTLTMAGGTLQADGGPVSLANALTVAAGTSFIDGPQNLTLTGPISGSGGLTKLGAGTLTLSGASSYTGNLTIAEGALIQNGGILPATVINQTNFVLNAGTFSGQLVNLGSFTYNGGTFSGQLVNQGTTTFNSNSFTAGNGIVNYSDLIAGHNFTFTINGSGLDNEGSFELAGGVLNGNGPLVNNNTISGFGTIAGSGGFTNNAFLSVSNGNLSLSNTGPNLNIGVMNLASGDFLQLASGVSLTNSGTLNLNGGLVSGVGTLINQGGFINGPGVISANFNNSSGVLLIGNSTTLTIVKPWTNGGIVQLTSASSNLTGGAVANSGTIQGLGTVSNAVNNTGMVEAIGGTLNLAGTTTNASSGTLAIDPGSKLVITAGLAVNSGTIEDQGGAFDNGSFSLNNTGVIAGFGTLRTGGAGLFNNGSISFTGGPTTVIGPVTNQNGRTITVAYNPALFTGLVTNAGTGTFNVVSATVTFAGGSAGNVPPLANAAGAAFSESGSGVIEVDGPPSLGNSSSIAVGPGSTLRFKATSGAAAIGTGVTATVAGGGTLELAGSVSALSSNSNRVDVVNNSSSAGILVSGTNQQVGNIDGSGTTQVNAGSDLTANHIIQSALVIGGTAASHGLVTIAASDSSDNPLAISDSVGVPALAGSAPPEGGAPTDSWPGAGDPALDDGDSMAAGAPFSPLPFAGEGPGGMGSASVGSPHSPNSPDQLANRAAVPEPPSLLLLLLAIAGGGVAASRRRKTSQFKNLRKSA